MSIKGEEHLSLQLASRPRFNVLSAGKRRQLRLPGGPRLPWSLRKGILGREDVRLGPGPKTMVKGTE